LLLAGGQETRRALTTPELRATKPKREEFLARPRRPVTVVLDGVSQNFNIDAIFRLCDGFPVRELVICGTKVQLHKRRLVQAAQGTQHWVPWSERQHASEAVGDAKAGGAWVLVAEQTTASVRPKQLGADISSDPGACRRAQRRLASGHRVSGYRCRNFQCWEWQIRSTSRPPLLFCFIGFLCVWNG
jgi:hypothetical protein